MSMLENITRGRESKPPRLFIYGQEGVGKSTVGGAAPNPVFVQTEDGLGEIDTAKFPLAKNLNDVLAALNALRDEPHDFQTLCIDSLDWAERIVWDKLCLDYGVRCIEKVDGGYGKGYTHALGLWRKITDLLDEIHAKRNMAVILIAHAKVERFEDPEFSSYDRYTPRLHKLAAGLLGEWTDAILFACRRMRVDATTGKAAPIGADGGERILRTNGSPTCIAKNRFNLPTELALSWTAFAECLHK